MTSGGKREGSGRKAKSIDHHKADGTYRADRHGTVTAADLCTRPKPRARSRCGRPGKWTRGPADIRAVNSGCWFDEQLAAYVVDWFRDHLRLSDGQWSGKPFELLDWQRDEIIYPLFGWVRKDEQGRIVRRFNQTYIEIPKKNGKSTLAAGVGLHMLAAEGNRGNEVYSAATDKDQASIVHGEAIRMVEASPKLSAFLKVNYSTRHIYNLDAHLAYRVISSRPAAGEGFKGNCVIIDELHAWYGDELWNALKYLGVNWPERLRFVITTAGDDTESVCFREYEKAKAVANGEEENERLLVCIHEAAAGDDIHDPAIQKKANPSLGHTISAADLNDNIREDEKTARTLQTLLRYRFNVWQTVAVPWLEMDQWRAAGEDYALEELVGLPCWAGLDLARVADMSALVLCFRRDTEYLLWLKFWLPRATAEKWSRLASYAEWERRGWLTLQDGEQADYEKIEDEIVTLFEQVNPRAMVYDEKYANEITERIERRCKRRSGDFERVPFPQTMTSFCGPTACFERLLGDGNLKHPNNGLLTWQAGNVQVKEDANKNIRPEKEKRGSHKSIDGIVAAIMAHDAAVRGVNARKSSYQRRGVLIV